MLKHRILSAMVLIPIVLWSILYAHPWILGGLLAFVLGLGAVEWMSLIPTHSRFEKIGYVVSLILCVALIYMNTHMALFVGMLIWCSLIVCILTYPRSVFLWGYRPIVALCGGLLLPLAYFSLSRIYHAAHGSELVIYLLFLVWAADTGGYFIGKRWGKTRLIPNVSPGKTLAGALGGALFLMLVAILGAIWFKPLDFLAWFIMAGIIFIFALFGDLFVSMLKRRVQLKDTGTLIPGHGGILDRIDSLISTAPCFAFCMYFFSGFAK
jgi:phosphatidate cytidylyltransferase